MIRPSVLHARVIACPDGRVHSSPFAFCMRANGADRTSTSPPSVPGGDTGAARCAHEGMGRRNSRICAMRTRSCVSSAATATPRGPRSIVGHAGSH